MTVFYIDEIKPQFAGRTGRAVKIINDAGDLLVGQYRRIRGQTNPGIKNRVVIQNPGLRPIMGGWTTVSSRMGQLQSDKRPTIVTGRLSMRCKQRGSQLRQAGKSVLGNHKLIRICSALV